ncbi:dihydroorotase [Natronorubrum thiooxidans]|uniref:Dihydropyrimidinase/dihydroorotase n=1 Tax=Natronorubrum thiooxidans TaxID=308853 RepID=A0A1N7GY04_9EURY|nr:amidohydrolase family protein [Natronorubrum thiooxidans]SIS17410.1 dihydropyrimidinase/dihydroorotase [Natronorubrum thiooxidans]
MVEATSRVVNARVVTPSGTIHGGMAAKDGKIVAIGSDSSLPEADETIDADGNYLIPGIICPHNHMGISRYENDYHTQYELDMETETKACLAGGVTSFFTFLLQEEPYVPDMDFFVDTGEQQSYIDFGFHAIVHQDHHIDEIDALAAEGIRSFKLFFNMYKTSAPELGIGHSDAGRVYTVLKKTAEMENAVVMFHAENDDLGPVKVEEIKSEGRDDLSAWADASPGISQAMQIEQIGMLTEHTGATTYVVHNSMEETVDALGRYNDRGVSIHGETLPSFLANHCEDEDVGTWGKISPPIGYKSDQEALWKALRNGTFDHVGTDHCPYQLEFKGPRDGSVWEAPPGDQGLQTFLPLMLSEGVNKNRISMERLVEVCSTNNAKRFGIYPRKGALVEGADADAVIVDLQKEFTVDEDYLYGLDNRWCSSFGRELTGAPTHTIKGGELVVEHNDVLTEGGIGSYLPRYEDGVQLAE